jgi:hypothetical protein
MRYILICDDNFHFTDETERDLLGEFESADAAIAAAKKIVDSDLSEAYKQARHDSGRAIDYYTSFGRDPFIRSEDGSCQFSAWDYANQRYQELCNPQK